MMNDEAVARMIELRGSLTADEHAKVQRTVDAAGRPADAAARDGTIAHCSFAEGSSRLRFACG